MFCFFFLLRFFLSLFPCPRILSISFRSHISTDMPSESRSDITRILARLLEIQQEQFDLLHQLQDLTGDPSASDPPGIDWVYPSPSGDPVNPDQPSLK